MIDELERIELYKQSNPNELTDQQFSKLEHEIHFPKPPIISDEYFDFKLWYQGYPSRQENFGKFLSRKLPKNEGIKILEVGCGRTARLSRILMKKGYCMTCIDPKLELEDLFYNIHTIKGKFDYKKFDLSEYDYVIAQEPCDATEHIVRACVKQQTPFMMTLCGVAHKLISGKTPATVSEWYEYLLNLGANQIKLRYVKLDPFLQTPILRSNKF